MFKTAVAKGRVSFSADHDRSGQTNERRPFFRIDCAIEVDGNAYSVPWRLIGERVSVILAGEELRVSHAGREVAVHRRCAGRFERRVDPRHFDGVVGFPPSATPPTIPAPEIAAPELLRPLIEYELLAGGRW